MRLRTDVIGALNLFSTTAEPLSAEDQQVAQALADIATIGILQERALQRRTDDRHVQLQSALESRIVIEQAKGIVARTQRTSASTTRSRSCAATPAITTDLLRQIAQDVINGTLTVEALTEATRRPGTS